MVAPFSESLWYLSGMLQVGRELFDWVANDNIVDTFWSKPPVKAFFLGVDGMANDMYPFSVGVDEEDLASLSEYLFE